jgi:putative ABC transport system ATP-binding protein
MKALELIGVTKVHGTGANTFRALDQVSLSVEAGELLAVMGPSGSGKTTLLTIAGGLEAPTEGHVLLRGRDLASMSRDERATLRRSSVGYVFQEFNLLSALTAAENVSMPLELDGCSTAVARRHALKSLARLGLEDRANHFPDDLSGGERQRVAIARALVSSGRDGEHRLLLADEPTGSLDSVNGDTVMAVLRAACDEGAAGVMVTHDARLASWADRVIFLRDGIMVDQTSPSVPESLLVSDSK